MGYQQKIGLVLLVLFSLHQSYALYTWVSNERKTHKKKKISRLSVVSNEQISDECDGKSEYKYNYNSQNIFKGSQDDNLYFFIKSFISIIVFCVLLAITLA